MKKALRGDSTEREISGVSSGYGGFYLRVLESYTLLSVYSIY